MSSLKVTIDKTRNSDWHLYKHWPAVYLLSSIRRWGRGIKRGKRTFREGSHIQLRPPNGWGKVSQFFPSPVSPNFNRNLEVLLFPPHISFHDPYFLLSFHFYYFAAQIFYILLGLPKNYILDTLNIDSPDPWPMALETHMCSIFPYSWKIGLIGEDNIHMQCYFKITSGPSFYSFQN